jgi:hypothetical protein
VDVESIPKGTYFLGEMGSCREYKGIFVKSYLGVVFLKNPGLTWVTGTVDNYRPLSHVEIKGE